MGKLFGTDGIRGIFNEEPVTLEMGRKVGRAVVRYFGREGARPRIVLGRDTRISGQPLQDAIVSGILSQKAEPVLVGELPTPGLAYVTRQLGAEAGVMISASHNPYEYNGFKIFSREGYKLDDEAESQIEDLIFSDNVPVPLEEEPVSAGEQEMGQAGERYLSFLQHTLRKGDRLENIKIVLDCANGATYRVAPVLFERMGAGAESLFVTPDGKNINQGCGSQHPEALCERVLETSADLGLAFDGDGDRMVAVDEKGNVLTGDQVLVISAKTLKDQGELKNNLVVSTVMSNMGLRVALRNLGIEHIASRVGDRYVLEEMRKSASMLGGEESGHIIFLQHHTTGDGLLSALQLLSAMKTSGQPLSQLASLMTVFPQVLINVPVKRKPEISSLPELIGVQQDVEARLGDRGRVLLRYSGTEPLCRVMIEGEQQEEIDRYARQIAEVVGRLLG
ncbi:MAG: phosphoglucosamine mutase [Desulfobacteraceae bacterium]|jgi:phosphoglucosamine mutase